MQGLREAAESDTAYGAAIACIDCGQQQTVLPEPHVECARCGATLEHGFGRSRRAALALSIAVLVLLVPGNLLSFLSTNLLGVSRHSHLISAADGMAQDGWPLLAAFIFLFAVLFPVLRFASLTLVLGALEIGRQPRWLGPLFRLGMMLQTWAMPDVFLLGLAIAYARLNSSITTHIGPGALCFIAAGVMSLFVRAFLDPQAVWRQIPLSPTACLKPMTSPATAATWPCPVAVKAMPVPAAGPASPGAFLKASAVPLRSPWPECCCISRLISIPSPLADRRQAHAIHRA
jgi:paraquat-inducible protein A